jgi:hypothetical protein
MKNFSSLFSLSLTHPQRNELPKLATPPPPYIESVRLARRRKGGNYKLATTTAAREENFNYISDDNGTERE